MLKKSIDPIKPVDMNFILRNRQISVPPFSALPAKIAGQNRQQSVIVFFLFLHFVCRYRNLHFTKNPEKYIKYTAEEVEAKLKTFFDVSA